MIPQKPIDAIWTDEQWKAIFLTGSNIIVSAGAGSGKTAVLTERIIQKLKQGISIDQLIVLTFTNAAAFEMKQRIRDKITQEALKNPHLQAQIPAVEQAVITTFDSYSLSLVKKYHYLLGLPKNISIIDSVLLEQKEKEFLDEIFLANYENPAFLKVLDTFTVKDDQKLMASVLEMYHKLDIVCKKEEYLKTYIDTFYEEKKVKENIHLYQEFIFKNVDLLVSLLDAMEEESDDGSLFFTEKIEGKLGELRFIKNYEDIYSIVSPIRKLPEFSKKLEEYTTLKEYYRKIEYYFKQLQDLCTTYTTQEMEEEIMATKETAQVFIPILETLNQKLMDYKRKNNLFTFSDITRLSIELLEDNEEIRKTIQAKTVEIMIDEYQDTNDIGDYFISLISNQNVYMVGDVKQSIYRFRNANPKIFMEKYEKYKMHIGGEAIDLNANFRSRKEVLENINMCFYPIMDKKIGGADYKDNHYLIHGNKIYDAFEDSLHSYNMEILDYHYKNTEYEKKYTKEEIEAFIIAEDIQSKVQNHYPIFDSKKKKLRDATYQDFVILLDRKTSFDLYKKIFEYKGIPLHIHKDESFLYSDEIYVLRSILKCIFLYEKKMDASFKKEWTYALYSIARSYLFSIDDATIFHAIVHDTFLTDEVFKPILDSLSYLSSYSKNSSLSLLLQEIYRQFSFFEKSLFLGNVEEISVKLEYLLTVVESLEDIGMNLEGLIGYLDKTFESNLDISYSKIKEEEIDAVNIMTIHKSKGLEYSVCYYAGLSKEFNRKDIKNSFLFDQQLGFIFPIFKEGKKDTIYKELLKQKEILEDVSERIRVFYVALTRAKEKMIFVNNVEEMETLDLPLQNGVVSELERLRYKSFQDIFLSIHSILKPFIRTISYNVSKDYEWINSKKIKNLEEPIQEIKTITCTIQKEAEEEKSFAKKSVEITSPSRLEVGTIFHTYLEYLDFHHIERDFEKYNVPKFYQDKVRKMLQTPIFAESETSQFYHEYSFSYEQGDTYKTGIIDLLIVKENEWIIVDYKTSAIDKDDYDRQVQGYIEYIQTITDKPVRGYLYSLMNEEYKEVEGVYV